MYIKRQIEEKMLEWKNRPQHFVLEIEGARQVGKTTAILHFCGEHYGNVLSINLADRTGQVFLDVYHGAYP